MSDSKIILAIRKYQLDYAWDKSLTNPNAAISSSQSSAPDTHSATYLEDFIASQAAERDTEKEYRMRYVNNPIECEFNGQGF